MKTIITLILASLVVMTLAACASSASRQSLTASPWLLTELNGEPPLTDTSINAEFDQEGRLSGSSGCNTYSTTYTVNGDQLAFSEQIISTMMACLEPVMEQENDFLKALKNTTTFAIDGTSLTLYDANGKALARFETINQSLAGTSWTVFSYNTGTQAVTSVILDTEITANFSEEGQLSGKASCNQYTSTYETENDNITIGPSVITLMLCAEPQGIMEQEQQYLAALESANTYKITGLEMEMRTEDGELAVSLKRVINP